MLIEKFLILLSSFCVSLPVLSTVLLSELIYWRRYRNSYAKAVVISTKWKSLHKHSITKRQEKLLKIFSPNFLCQFEHEIEIYSNVYYFRML